jgi:enoyl-CoA hydratase/carnithine racemase
MALTPHAALESLRSPFALEDLEAAGPFVVDATGGGVELGDVLDTLRALPCVTVAVCSAAAPRWTAPFDVVVTEDDVAGLEASIARTPMAALTLVQLLRTSETLDAWAALFAESATYSMLQAGPEFRGWLAGRDHHDAVEPASRPCVLVDRAGDRVHLTLNRPETHNAFGAAMRDELVTQLRAVAADTTVARVHLDGAGPSFCSGGDLREFGTTPDPATAHRVRTIRSPAWWLHECRARTSVGVHGACIGAGIELAAFAADVRAAEDAFFQLPEVGFGLVPGAGGTVSLPRRVGRQRTAWLALTGRRIDVGTALDWGLVDRVNGRPPRR